MSTLMKNFHGVVPFRYSVVQVLNQFNHGNGLFKRLVDHQPGCAFPHLRHQHILSPIIKKLIPTQIPRNRNPELRHFLLSAFFVTRRYKKMVNNNVGTA